MKTCADGMTRMGPEVRMYRCGRYHSPTRTNSIIYWSGDAGQV